MNFDTLIDGYEEICWMQEPYPCHRYFRYNFPFLHFAIKTCPEHSLKVLNGMKFDTLIES